MRAFDQALQLSNALQNDNRITSRRKNAEDLRDLLSEPRYQEQLIVETNNDLNKINHVWRLAVKSAVLAAKKSLTSKTVKTIQAQDIMLPLKIMNLADKDSERLQPGLFRDVDMAEDYGNRNGVSGLGDDVEGRRVKLLFDKRSKSRFSSSEVVMLLEFCLSCLGDERPRDFAEYELMTMLCLLCSRTDYVVHFHQGRDFQHILSEVEERLVGATHRHGMSDNKWLDIVDTAAKIFANLVYQLTVPLGYSLHMHLTSCLDMVMRWCHSTTALVQGRGTASSNQIQFIYSVATNILTTHTEQCVPFMRKHGRDLLSLAKKSFQHTTGQTRDALMEYFSAHM